MSTYTVVQAKSRLSELIKRAEKGEGVVITRRGQPAVELRAIEEPKRIAQTVTKDQSEFLLLVRAIPEHVKRAAEREVRQMRDEGEA